MAPSGLSSYRPAVLLLAGFTATFAALLIHQHYLKASSSGSGVGLHRSNAVRGPNPRRRRAADGSDSSGSSGSATVSELAIAHLLAREASGTEYGIFRTPATMDTIHLEMLPEFRLLPSQLPSATDLQSLGWILDVAVHDIRERIQRDFVYSFITQEYPSNYFIQHEEAEYLRDELTNLNIDAAVVQTCIFHFNTGMIPGIHRAGTRGLQRLTEPLVLNDAGPDAATQVLDTRETVADDPSRVSPRISGDIEGEDDERRNVMSLVYRVAEDEARKDNYVHRGVMCNGCRIQPIQGIRYSCANCPDYDLCEDCEAHQIHIQTHIFYKVRIPAPLLGYHRPTAPTWYPGKPHLLTEELRREFPPRLKADLQKQYNLESAELQAHWEQFICLAGCSWGNDPIKLGLAIDRDGFDKCFCPPTSLRSPPPNLIYERMFAFYDTNNDGKIGFEEFLVGIVNLQDKSRGTKLRRIFNAYDFDNDGYVSRRDFLRLFRAYYSYSKEMMKASIAAFDENRDDPFARDADRDDVRKKVESGRPISAIFDGQIPAGHASRGALGKSVSPDANGDLTIVDKNGVLDEDSEDIGDHNEVIGDAALENRRLGSSFHSFRPLDGPHELPRDNAEVTPSGSDAALGHIYGWPPINEVESEDIFNALGRAVPVEEVMDPVERARVIYAQSQRLDAEADRTIHRRAIHDRWQRREFYTDAEEGATAPPGYVEADSSDDDFRDDNGDESPDSASNSRRQSFRSRSSSKVRFEDDVTDTDYETRSNTSSRSIPVGERWGGYEVRDVEKDVGKEVLYQAIQQGFNELLDPLFKGKEDLAVAANATRAVRRKWADKIDEHFRRRHDGPTNNVDRDIREEDLDHNGGVSTDQDIFGAPPVPEAPHTRNQSPPANFSTETRAVDHSSILSRRSEEAQRHQRVLDETAHSGAPSSSDTEPTLPQNRPESISLSDSDCANNTNTASPTTSRTAHLSTLNAASQQATPGQSSVPLSQQLSYALPPVADPEPSAEMLDLWVKHHDIDAEAKKRGGHGRLNFEEFAKKMVDNDATAAALGSEEDENGEQKWGESARLGHLWFVGTWIEQASF